MFYQRPFDDPRTRHVQDIAATIVHLKDSNFYPFTLFANALEFMFPMHPVVDSRSKRVVWYLDETRVMSRKFMYDVSPYTRYLSAAAKNSDVFHPALLTERAKIEKPKKTFGRAPLLWRLINSMSGIKIKQDLPDTVAEEIFIKKLKDLMVKEANLKGFTTGGQILNPPKGE